MAGSSFKPFALLANARLGGTVYDTYSGKSPQYFRGMGTPVSNDGGYSFGNVTLVKATAYSMNTVFVGLTTTSSRRIRLRPPSTRAPRRTRSA